MQYFIFYKTDKGLKNQMFNMSVRTIRLIIFLTSMATAVFEQHANAQNEIRTTGVDIISDIEFKKSVNTSGDSIALKMDVYSYPKVSHSKKPVIIFVHGGGFWEGDKRSDLYIKMATSFAVNGFISFSVNYQLKDKETPYDRRVLDTCISDIVAATRWIKANSNRFGIDTSKILICGDSAGGGIVVNASYGASFDVSFAGCIDLWGGIPGDHGWDAQIFSTVLKKKTPPTCIIHGTKDNIIPYATSRNLANALSAAGIYYELHPLENADHYPVQLSDHFIPIMIAFADKVLKKKLKSQKT